MFEIILPALLCALIIVIIVTEVAAINSQPVIYDEVTREITSP